MRLRNPDKSWASHKECISVFLRKETDKWKEQISLVSEFLLFDVSQRIIQGFKLNLIFLKNNYIILRNDLVILNYKLVILKNNLIQLF